MTCLRTNLGIRLWGYAAFSVFYLQYAWEGDDEHGLEIGPGIGPPSQRYHSVRETLKNAFC